eukprot:3039176-Prymnesium_polylepis.1
MMNGPHGAVQSAASRTGLVTAADPDGTRHADPCSTSMACNHEQQRTQVPLSAYLTIMLQEQPLS